MTTTVTVPTEFVLGVPARSGLPPRNSIPRVLDGQSMFLSAGRRYSVYVPLGREWDDPLPPGAAPPGDGELILLRVPPWCRYIRWGVVAAEDTGQPRILTWRTHVDGVSSPENWTHVIDGTAPGDELAQAVFYESYGPPTEAQVAQDISAAATPDAAWRTLGVILSLVDAYVHGVVFHCLREREVTG